MKADNASPLFPYGELPTILVVEDDPVMRDSLCEILEAEGYHAHAASGGFEALLYLDTRPVPGLILLDLFMGMMSGWEFRRRQLAAPRVAHIPVLIVSGAPDLERQAVLLDAVGYVPKPVDVGLLLERVGWLLFGRSREIPA